MTDTGQTISVPDSMKLSEMIALEKDTQGRFSFTVDISGKYAVCSYVNYVKPRVKDDNGAYKLEAHIVKKVIILAE